MKKSKWELYWQKRTVKAEETLITIQAIADVNGHTRIEEMITAYFASVAGGGVKDVELPDAAHSCPKEKS